MAEGGGGCSPAIKSFKLTHTIRFDILRVAATYYGLVIFNHLDISDNSKP